MLIFHDEKFMLSYLAKIGNIIKENKVCLMSNF